MTEHAHWVGPDFEGGTGAFLAASSNSAHHERLDELMLGLYESEPTWYLSQQDGHATLETDPARVGLCDNDGVLLTYTVDEAWLEVARADGAILLVFAHDDAPETVRAMDLNRLLEARDDDRLELIVVAVGPPEDDRLE
jgi:hypothetical protein